MNRIPRLYMLLVLILLVSLHSQTVRAGVEPVPILATPAPVETTPAIPDAGLLPTSSIYWIKITGEKIHLFFTAGASARLDYLAYLSKLRLAEAQTLASRGDIANVTPALRNYTFSLIDIQKLITNNRTSLLPKTVQTVIAQSLLDSTTAIPMIVLQVPPYKRLEIMAIRDKNEQITQSTLVASSDHSGMNDSAGVSSTTPNQMTTSHRALSAPPESIPANPALPILDQPTSLEQKSAQKLDSEAQIVEPSSVPSENASENATPTDFPTSNTDQNGFVRE